MAIMINKARAREVLRAEASAARAGESVDEQWRVKIEALSLLCEQPGSSRTHIAFLCTEMLAMAVDPRVDLYAIKPSHAQGSAHAYSARSLCHSVIVPLSAELGFNIGVTGREPLNNQPYFRMTRLGDGTPVHTGAQAAFDYMSGLVKELHEVRDAQEARKALRAFIFVRRGYQPRYCDGVNGVSITPTMLLAAITRFVGEDSEGGRRAQAIVAALLDVVVGEDRVESGRINDPSRHYPGDVCVRAPDDEERWEKALEVRDKPVTAGDIMVFGRKCATMGVMDAAVVAVAATQGTLDTSQLTTWADDMGLGLTLFIGWDGLVDQALFWAGDAKPVAAGLTVQQIHQRLIAVEASPRGVERWLEIAAELGQQ